MIRSEIGILLEIILNAFKCLTVSLSTEILILAIVQVSLILVSILCELAMLPDVYIYYPLKKNRSTLLPEGKMYTSGSTFIKKIEPFTLSVIILVCLVNT